MSMEKHSVISTMSLSECHLLKVGIYRYFTSLEKLYFNGVVCVYFCYYLSPPCVFTCMTCKIKHPDKKLYIQTNLVEYVVGRRTHVVP